MAEGTTASATREHLRIACSVCATCCGGSYETNPTPESKKADAIHGARRNFWEPGVERDANARLRSGALCWNGSLKVECRNESCHPG